jgi:hypothetical protein
MHACIHAYDLLVGSPTAATTQTNEGMLAYTHIDAYIHTYIYIHTYTHMICLQDLQLRQQLKQMKAAAFNIAK